MAFHLRPIKLVLGGSNSAFERGDGEDQVTLVRRVDLNYSLSTWGCFHGRMFARSEMSKVLDEVLNANTVYTREFGERGKLAMPPARRFAILTCMDARLDPAKFAGLAEGDAHVIRNAGGRASDDAIRSLVISYKLLGTREWFVIHHTDCGMLTFTNDIMRDLLSKSLETSGIENGAWKDSGEGPGSEAGQYVEWLTIKDLAKSVTADVTRIRTHPLVPSRIPIYGYIYDVTSGKLIEVPEAAKAGEAQGQTRAAGN